MSPKRKLIRVLVIMAITALCELGAGQILARNSPLLLSSLLMPSLANANETEGLSTPAGKCRNAFPNLISDIPWKTMFPIRIGGKKIIDMGDLTDNIDAMVNPDDFNPSDYTCTCKNGNGMNDYGTYVSFWEPARVIRFAPSPSPRFSVSMSLSGSPPG